MIDVFVSLGIMFFESICVMVFFDCLLERKKKPHNLLWLLAITIPIFTASILVSFTFQNTKSLGQTTIKFIILSLFYALICCRAYKAKYIKALILSAIAFLLIYFVDYIGIGLTVLVTGLQGAVEQADTPTRLFYTMIYKAALFLILMIIRALSIKMIHGDMTDASRTLPANKFRWFLYFLIPTLCLVSLAGIYSLTSNGQHANPLLLLLAIAWLFMCFIVFYFLQIADEHEVKYRTSQVIEQSIKTELEGLKAIAIVNENYHEYQNDLVAIKNYLSKGNPEMALAYINKLPYSGMLSAPQVRTGNDVVDAIINQKYWLARNKDIHILPVLSNLDNLMPTEQQIRNDTMYKKRKMWYAICKGNTVKGPKTLQMGCSDVQIQ